MPDDIIELWSNFKFVELMLSIDGIGDMNKWLRYPTDWATVHKTLDKVEQSPDNIIGKAQFIFFSLENSRFLEIWKWPNSIRWNRIFKKIQ